MEINKIKETCLYVKSLKKTVTFFNKILGFPIYSYVEDRHAFFKVGPNMLLCFNPEDSKVKKSPPGHFAIGKQHVAFEVDHLDYESTKKELENKGVKIIDEMTWTNKQKSFYFEDPSGNILEIVPTGIWDS
jgi:catechol 2,3-dioxygenase-like lactoylglutathione lyase family enzyme